MKIIATATGLIVGSFVGYRITRSVLYALVGGSISAIAIYNLFLYEVQ